MFEGLSSAFSILIQPSSLGIIIIAIVIGWIVGVLPGIGAINALTIALPFTFGWDPMVAMYLLIAIYGASHFAGSITAILLNTPGEPVNAATVLDGYPMAKKGLAGKAIGIASSGEMFGALISVVVLIALLPFMRVLVMAFGPPEIFWMMMLALTTVAWASGENMLKGLAMGGLGILISMVGFSSVHSNVARFNGPSMYLWDGIELVGFIVGLLAVSALIDFTLEGGSISKKPVNTSIAGAWDGFKEVFRHKLCLIRSSLIGIIVGIMPGIGAATSTFLGYSVAVQSSKHPETFGTGDPEGVLASEAAVGATTPGDLVPTLAFGIPGSAVMAIVLGAFVLHGITPGPLLLREHMDIAWALILGLALSKVLASIGGIFAAPLLAKVAQINVIFLSPVVLILCLIGSFVVNESMWDVGLTIIAGILGFAMNRFRFPIISLIMGYLLGVGTENSLFSALQSNWGEFSIFFRPLALVVFILFLGVASIPVINLLRAKKTRDMNKVKEEYKDPSLTRGSFYFTLFLMALDLYFIFGTIGLSAKAAAVPLAVSIPTFIMLSAVLAAHKYPKLIRAFETRPPKIPTMGADAKATNELVEKLGESMPEEAPAEKSTKKILIMISWMVGFFVAALLIGLPISMPLFLFSYMRISGKASWLSSILVAVIVGGGIYYLFQNYIQIDLFEGILFGGRLPPL